MAERLRAAIAVHDTPVTARDGVGLTLRLTASFGVAELDGGQGLEALLTAADAALYAAKAAGCDCVRVSKPAGG